MSAAAGLSELRAVVDDASVRVAVALSPPDAPRGRGRPFDPAARARAQKRPRGTGVWVYIPGVVLEAAGFTAEPAPWFRLYGHRRSRNAGSVIVSLYREP